MTKLKADASVRVTVTQETNAKFRLQVVGAGAVRLGLWAETMPDMNYRGQEVQPSFERFRKDLTILAGRFHPVWTVRAKCASRPTA